MKSIGNDSHVKAIKIKDLGVAAYIVSNDIRPLSFERLENTVYFVFPKDSAERLIASYWSDNEPYIPARQLFAAQRSLKDLIFSGGPA